MPDRLTWRLNRRSALSSVSSLPIRTSVTGPPPTQLAGSSVHATMTPLYTRCARGATACGNHASLTRRRGGDARHGDAVDDQVFLLVRGAVDGKIPSPRLAERRVGDPDGIRHPAVSGVHPLPWRETVAGHGIVQ